MSIIKNEFGLTQDGTKVYAYTIENKNGMQAIVSEYGAVLVSVVVKTASGDMRDVVLGYDDVSGYEHGSGYFGAAIGRNGNRIAGASFTIDGVSYQMKANESGNNLHSGPVSYSHKMWQSSANEADNSVTFSYVSPDGEQGFPGEFKISVTYQLTDDNEIVISYDGISDKKTVANMTNHSYFNLNGHGGGDILGHKLWIKASNYTPVADSAAIPTGEIVTVKGTPMDFTTAKAIGEEIDAAFDQLLYTKGYDHNYVIDKESEGVEKMAEAAAGGLLMEVFTDLPGVQFYAGNGITRALGKGGIKYGRRAGFCLETQYYPNSVNEAAFPSPVIDAGVPYKTVTIYKFTNN